MKAVARSWDIISNITFASHTLFIKLPNYGVCEFIKFIHCLSTYISTQSKIQITNHEENLKRVTLKTIYSTKRRFDFWHFHKHLTDWGPNILSWRLYIIVNHLEEGFVHNSWVSGIRGIFQRASSNPTVIVGEGD